MRTTFSLLISCVVTTALSVFSLAAQAQTPSVHPGAILEVQNAPALTFSFRSANALLEAADTTIDKINEPMFKWYTGFLRLSLSPEGPLGGFDLDRPIGLIIDPQYGSAAVFPVQNWETIQKNLTKNGGSLTSIDQNRYKFSKDDAEIFLLLQDNWLAVSMDNNAAMSKSIPKPCLDGLEQLSKIYLVGAAINSSRMTAKQIKELLKGIQNQLIENLSSQGASSDILKMIMESLSDSIIQSLQRYQKDRLTFLLGLNFDPQSGFKLEAALCTSPETETAQQFLKFKSATTHLSGFYDPKAPISLSFSNQGRLSVFDNKPELVKRLHDELNQQIEKNFTNDQTAKDVQHLKDKISDLVSQAISDSNNEMAITIYGAPDQGATFLGAVYCKHGQEMEDYLFNYIIKEVLSANKTMFSFYKGLKRNVAKINDVRVYTLTFALPKDDNNCDLWHKIIKSDDLVIAFGFGDNVVCVSIGADALDKLKTALETTGTQQTSPVFEYNIQYGSITQFIESYFPLSEESSKTLAKFKKTMGKQYSSPCQKSSILFVDQTPSACVIRYQEDFSFEVIKFVAKYVRLRE